MDVSCVSISLQTSLESLQEFHGAIARVAGRKVVASIGVVGVPDIGPEVSGASVIELIIP